MRRRKLTVAASLAVLVVWVIPAPASSGVDCDDQHFLDNHPVAGADGATPSTNTGIDGVRGTLLVPNWTTANLRGQSETVADVILNIEDSAGHFFQLGWYISAEGIKTLEATSTPKPFFGEGIAGMYGLDEKLTTLQVPLTPGAHTFEIVQIRSADPYWNLKFVARIDSSQVWTSSMISTMEGTPSVVGETNWDCADMYESASSPSGGPGLYGHHRTRGWSLWQQHLDRRYNSALDNPGCWAVGRYQNQTATSFAWDVC